MKYLDEFKTTFQSEGLESAFQVLKRLGARRTEVIWILVQHYGYTIPEADKLVLHSETWKEDYQQTVLLRDVFYKALENEDETEG